MTDKDEDLFVSRVVKVLDDGVDALDSNAGARLRQSRHMALDSGTQSVAWGMALMQWLPAGGVAMAMMALVATTIWIAAPEVDIFFVEEIEMLASGESIELIDELEFYQWLDEEDMHAG